MLVEGSGAQAPATISSSGARGDGGDINIHANVVELRNGGLIRATTDDRGDAGDVTINAGEIFLSGQSPLGFTSRILAESENTDPTLMLGAAGQIDLNATGSVNLTDGALVRTRSLGNGATNDIRITAGDSIRMSRGASVTSEAIEPNANVTAGDIVLNAGNAVTLETQASITAESLGQGNAGNIQVTAGSIDAVDSSLTTNSANALGGNINLDSRGRVYLFRSSVTTDVKGGTGQGGDLTVNAQTAIFNASTVTANAAGNLTAGNIFINVSEGFLESTNNMLQATNALGIQGEVVVQGPNAQAVGELSQLPANFLDASAQLEEACVARDVDSGSFAVIRDGKFALAPDVLLESPDRSDGDEGDFCEAPRMSVLLPAFARSEKTSLRWVILMIGLLSLLSPIRSAAQGLEPGKIRPALPEPLNASESEEKLALPPIGQPSDTPPTLESGLAVEVKAFAVHGCTVFTDEELDETLRPWIGRKIESEELLAARDAVTQLYLDGGFATSGVVIPDQDVANGIVQLVAVEGHVSKIEIRGNQRFRERYFKARLEAAASAPVHVPNIERALRIMQRDPWIERIDVLLEPGESMGESRLVVSVTEALQWKLAAEAANDRSPAVGSAGGIFEARVANLSGFRDETSFRFQGTAGLLDFDAQIEVPITRWDTRLKLRARITETELQEEPFKSLDINASARTYGITLGHPLYRSESDELWFVFEADRRQTRSSLLGEAFCFELILTSCQRVVLTAFRVGAEWSHRTPNSAIAARTRFSWGVDAFGAKTGGGHDAPDGEFFSWLAQLQYAYVLPESWRSTQVLLRADAQLADDPLLSIEKLAVGGRRTVRGYRENTLVRDNGIMLSGELRIPVVRDSLRRPMIELVPFMDWGHAKNKGIEPEDDTLWSAGIGTRIQLRHGLLAEVYWGARLEDVSNPKDVLQDYGVHMRLRIEAPDAF